MAAASEKRTVAYYRLLQASPGCSKAELKSKFLEQAKLCHPDVGGPAASAQRFTELQDAYHFLLEQDFPDDQPQLPEKPEIPEFDIRHTAPQHRQYLEFEGLGSGTPSQRLRQHQQYRVDRASQNVSDYVTEKLVSKQAAEGEHGELIHTKDEAMYARRWRSRNAIERLVEDLIQESMRRGDFDNLPGAGKPLKCTAHNPYLDVQTQKLNEILVQNGYCPEWAMLEKEIKAARTSLQQALSVELIKQCSTHSVVNKLQQSLHNAPGNQVPSFDFVYQEAQRRVSSNNNNWQLISEQCRELNKKIDHFNLICPMCKQMVQCQLVKEAKRVWDRYLASLQELSDTENPTTASSSTKQEPIARSSYTAASEAFGNSLLEDTGYGVFRSLLNYISARN